jgi:hypothetical protein
MRLLFVIKAVVPSQEAGASSDGFMKASNLALVKPYGLSLGNTRHTVWVL